MPIGLDVSDVVVAPDGKSLVVTGDAEGQTNVYTYSIDEDAKEPATARQITSSSTAKDDIAIGSDGKDVFFLEEGRIGVASIEKRESRALSVTAEFDADFAADRMTLFDQAWSCCASTSTTRRCTASTGMRNARGSRRWSPMRRHPTSSGAR